MSQRKAREARRMSAEENAHNEQLQQEFKETMQRIEDWALNDTWPDGPFHACTLNTYHKEDCDGTCPTVTKWEIALTYEQNMWRIIKIDPMEVMNTPTLELNVRNKGIIRLLLDKGLVTQDEVDETYVQAKFEVLHDLRINRLDDLITEHNRAAARSRIAMPPNGSPRIIQ